MNRLVLLGERLAEERKRKALNQTDFAALGGVSLKTQVLYEKSERVPDASYLAAVAAEGVDILYVVTGELASTGMSPDEQALLAAYRALDVRSKAAAIGAVAGLGQPQVAMPGISVGGSVGQYVGGNQTGAVNIDMSKGRKKRT
ncbi:helix-turn-helix domain-containing protein [Ralstonia pseudosolanacearum]